MAKCETCGHLEWGVYYQGVLVAAVITKKTGQVIQQNSEMTGIHTEPIVVKKLRARPAEYHTLLAKRKK